MWIYRNYEVGGVNIFESKKEAMKFIKMGTEYFMKEYPEEPDMWNMLGEDIGELEEVFVQTAEEAYEEWRI